MVGGFAAAAGVSFTAVFYAGIRGVPGIKEDAGIKEWVPVIIITRTMAAIRQ
jgi:hypothetical protein